MGRKAEQRSDFSINAAAAQRRAIYLHGDASIHSHKRLHHSLKSPLRSCISIKIARIITNANHSIRDGKRFAVRADEKLMAFLELETAIGKIGIDTLCRRSAELHSR